MSSRLLAGRYELIEKVGDGGMAIVYRGKDRLLNRYVAIKILRPEYTKDKQFIDNFKNESQAAAGLTHPNIVGIYDVGQEGNIHYIVMEYIEGKALSEIIKEKGRLDYKEAMDITKQVASALSLAHKNQIIHRDIKPHNIMITNTGVAKLADFGIARAVSSSTIVSGSNKVMGSVHYFSPEQARASYVDERSDIYSLGIVLYEMITGKVPFDGDNPVSIALMHINQPMPSAKDTVPGIPPQLDRIIKKATDKYQTNRFKSADEMIEAIESIEYISRVMGSKAFSGLSHDAGSIVSAGDPVQTDDGSGDDVKPYVRPGRKTETNSDSDDSEPARTGRNGSDTAGGRHTTRGSGGKSGGSKSGIGGLLESENSDKMIKGMIIAAVCIIIIAGIVLFGTVQGWFSKDKESFELPSVTGMTFEEAQELLESKGLKIEKGDELFSADQDEGKITSQSPVSGTMVQEGRTITVNISLGKQDDVVPKIVGMKLDSATQYLEKFGFKIGTVRVIPGTEEADTILSQSILEGSTAKEGTSIDVEVSDGKAKKLVQMPNLNGMTPEQADAALTNQGLETGSVTFEEVENVNENLVFRQQYSYGTELEQGTKVDYVVSKKPPEPEPEPEPEDTDDTPDNDTPGGTENGNTSGNDSGDSGNAAPDNGNGGQAEEPSETIPEPEPGEELEEDID